jgi:hypothetical protein
VSVGVSVGVEEEGGGGGSQIVLCSIRFFIVLSLLAVEAALAHQVLPQKEVNERGRVSHKTATCLTTASAHHRHVCVRSKRAAGCHVFYFTSSCTLLPKCVTDPSELLYLPLSSSSHPQPTNRAEQRALQHLMCGQPNDLVII